MRPGRSSCGRGWCVERGAAAGAEVGGDVDLDGDLFFGEDFEELGVVLGGEAVADAFGADVDGGPDGGGAVDGAAGFSGVGGEAEAGVAGFGVEVAEEGGGAAGLVATDADADDGGVLGAELGGFAEDAGGLVGAEVADGVDEPEEGGAELFSRRGCGRARWLRRRARPRPCASSRGCRRRCRPRRGRRPGRRGRGSCS